MRQVISQDDSIKIISTDVQFVVKCYKLLCKVKITSIYPIGLFCLLPQVIKILRIIFGQFFIV